ncbi:GntR family transcriptional regulator [Lacticaseibacillus suihuaensis]
MHFDASSVVPLYHQIAQQFTAGILSGAFPEESQIPSTTEVARTYAINPATVLRGMNELVDAGVIEKRRGVGMFVVQGARDRLAAAQQAEFFAAAVPQVVRQAKALGITAGQLTAAIEKEYNHE